MREQGESKKAEVEDVSTKELAAIRQALAAKYGVHLRPGESLSVDAERSAEHAYVGVVIEKADGSYRLELEAAALESDPHTVPTTPQSRFASALDLVDAQLAEFFAEERDLRFHPDYRPYEIDGFQIRFRGQLLRPDLENLADAWLSAGGDPEKS